MIYARETNNRWTVVSPAGILALQVTLEMAKSICSGAEPSTLTCDDATWKAALLQAVAAESKLATDSLEGAATVAEVAAVKQRQAGIEAAIAQVWEMFQAKAREDEIARLRYFQQGEYQRLVEALGFEPNADGRRMLLEHLASTKAGRRLEALNASST
jgi:hypothetical protein